MTSRITPYLCVADARAAIDWYAAALGAAVTHEPVVMDDGRIGHCELTVGAATWMLADEFPEEGVAAPAFPLVVGCVVVAMRMRWVRGAGPSGHAAVRRRGAGGRGRGGPARPSPPPRPC